LDAGKNTFDQAECDLNLLIKLQTVTTWPTLTAHST